VSAARQVCHLSGEINSKQDATQTEYEVTKGHRKKRQEFLQQEYGVFVSGLNPGLPMIDN
jgi:hypothetical protein